MDTKTKEKNTASIGIKSFIGVVCILMGIIIVVGVLTYIIPAGKYDLDESGNIIATSFRYIEGSGLPFYRWFSAPVEALFGVDGPMIMQISALLLILGGAFTIIEKSGGTTAMITMLINKHANRRGVLVGAFVLFFMAFASVFGVFEEALILLPILLILCKSMGWDNTTAVMLCLLSLGVGFSAATLNPFTLGVAAQISGTSVLTGLWFRIIIFIALWLGTTYFICRHIKKTQKPLENSEQVQKLELNSETKRKARIFSVYFLSIFAIMITIFAVPALADFAMIALAAGFLVGSIVSGILAERGFKKPLKYFASGMLTISPAVIVLMLAFSAKYIAQTANILDTIIHTFTSNLAALSPHVSILIIFGVILTLDFFISSGTAKASLLIPILTFVPITGVSAELIILAFVLGDGFTNSFYPTNAALLIGLSISDVDYTTWFKRTWKFMIFTLILFVLALQIGVLIKY